MKCLLCDSEATEEYIGFHHKCMTCGFEWWEQTEMMGLGFDHKGYDDVVEAPLGCLAVLPGEVKV